MTNPLMLLMFGLALIGSRGSSRSSTTKPAGRKQTPRRQSAAPTFGGLNPRGEELNRILEGLGFGPRWRRFLLVTAYRESRFFNTAHNDRQSEVDASREGFDRVRDRLDAAGCNPLREEYAIGTVGLFAAMPAYAGFMIDMPCLPIAELRTNTIVQIAVATGYASALMGAVVFKTGPSWASLSRGWKAPNKMGTGIAAKAKIMEDRATAIGISSAPGWPLERVTELPITPQSIMLATSI